MSRDKRSIAFEEPRKDAKIWRYLDISKFIFMLSKKSLVFSRVDKMDDPFEGSYTKQSLKIREKNYDILTKKDSQKVSEVYKKLN